MILFLDRLIEEDDLCGMDWLILHGIESLKQHNEEVVRNWMPSYWRKLMLPRIVNSGVKEINGTEISSLLSQST
jgi:hypothetical protein